MVSPLADQRHRGTPMPARLGSAMGLLGAAMVLAACGGASPGATKAPPPGNASAVVDIKNIAFNPATVSVQAGQTVAWKFDDGVIAHNVTGADWHSADRNSGYFSHTFPAAGTFSYRCTIHTGMDGTVVVTP